MTLVVTCALAIGLLVARMDGMRSVVLVMSVDGEVAGPGSCIETRDGFLDLNTFLKICFISIMISWTGMIKVNDNDYIREK